MVKVTQVVTEAGWCEQGTASPGLGSCMEWADFFVASKCSVICHIRDLCGPAQCKCYYCGRRSLAGWLVVVGHRCACLPLAFSTQCESGLSGC